MKISRRVMHIKKAHMTHFIFFFPHAPIGLAAWASERDGNAISLLMSGAVRLRLGAKILSKIVYNSKHMKHLLIQ